MKKQTKGAFGKIIKELGSYAVESATRNAGKPPTTFIEAKQKDMPAGSNHTFMTWVAGEQVWITALTSEDPTLNEYRMSFPNGVVRYSTIDEFMGTPYEPFIPLIKKLSDKIDEADMKIEDGELYTR